MTYAAVDIRQSKDLLQTLHKTNGSLAELKATEFVSQQQSHMAHSHVCGPDWYSYTE